SLHATFGLIIPIASFVVVLEVTRRNRLGVAAWPIARHGVARRDVAIGMVLAAAVFAGVLGALFGFAGVAAAPPASSAAVALDAAVSCRIGALAGVAYVGWFALGATFFGRGRGIWVVLVADFVLGDSTGFFGAALPRGNAMNLLGGAPPLGLP